MATLEATDPDEQMPCASLLSLCAIAGAGWGGCCISLVTESEVPRFIETLRAAYGPYKTLDDAALDQAIFATKPGSGCGLYALDDQVKFF